MISSLIGTSSHLKIEGGPNMTNEQAARILDPETSRESLAP